MRTIEVNLEVYKKDKFGTFPSRSDRRGPNFAVPVPMGFCLIGVKCPLKPSLEGHGDLVSRLITPISQIITPIIPNIILLSPHDPPSRPWTPDGSRMIFRDTLV